MELQDILQVVLIFESQSGKESLNASRLELIFLIKTIHRNTGGTEHKFKHIFLAADHIKKKNSAEHG